MGRMEADLGTGLDWAAVNHWNTDNPHTHIVSAGATTPAKPHHRGRLHRRWVPPSRRRTGDRMAGATHRAGDPADLAARGGSGAVDEPGSHLEAREAGEDGRCRSNGSTNRDCNVSALLLIGRLQLAAPSLADETQPGTWAVHADAERPCAPWASVATSSALQRHARRATWAGGVRTGRRWPNHHRPRGREGAGRRVARPGLSGHRRRGWQGPLRRAQRPRRAGELSHRRGGGGEGIGRRARDKNIAALASDGLYRTDHHLAILQGRPCRAAIRRKSLQPTSAGSKPCAGPASWSAWPWGGRCRMTCPSRAAATTQRLGGVAVELKSHLPIERQARVIGPPGLTSN